jgi:hypothetical protein
VLKLYRLARRYLDFEFSLRDGATLRIVERPGRWMRPQVIEALLSDMQTVAKTHIPAGLHYGILSGKKERLDNAIISLLYDGSTRKPIAFNAYSLLDIELHGRPADVLHLGLIMIDPRYQALGYTWVIVGLPCLLVYLRSGFQTVWISNVTQVPAIVGKVAEAFSEIHPSPFNQTRRSFAHLSIARQLFERHRSAFGVGDDAWFDPEHFVIRNAYTGGSDDLRKRFEDTTHHRDPRANDFCRERLDYERGDDVIQIGLINFACVKEYLLRGVPRDSLPRLVFSALLVLIGRLVLPVVHWFHPGRQLGDLRPTDS